MGVAQATVGGNRIEVRTRAQNDFDFMVAACKRVPGGRFKNQNGDKFWHYPLSVHTCLALRRIFGKDLQVGRDLAAWYLQAQPEMQAQTELSSEDDAPLPGVPAAFAQWLRGYQRAGAAWVARGYRNAGLVADKPGLGKTPEVLAGLLQAGITGPVLVVCPRASVKLVWGKEIQAHMPDVPVYLCSGTREKRQAELNRFADDMRQDRAVERLRIVVVVAEMLRVELGDPCYTAGGNKVSGMCGQRRKTINGTCGLHAEATVKYNAEKTDKERRKDLVPVDFSFPRLFESEPLRGGWRAVILDESHKLLGSLSIAKGNLMGKGLRLLPYRQDPRRYAMSGTPFGKGGRIEGMFGSLHWLWPDEYTSYWRWAAEVFELQEKRINRKGDTVKVIGPMKGLSANATPEQQAQAWEQFMKSLGPRILRRTKEECLKNLPPKTYNEVLCEMHPAQARQMRELADYAEVRTEGGIVAPNGSLALLMRSRQLANGEISKRRDEKAKVFFTDNSGKLDQLWEALETRGILDGQPGDKLIVASKFNEFLDTIAWRLNRDKVAYFRIDGSTSEKLRESQIGEWQASSGTLNCRVMLVNTAAAGISINLDAADEMHIMDEDTDPGVNEQLEDRIHRASRDHKVFIYYYRTIGSIDHKRATDTEFRRRLQHTVLDGRRGLEDIRQMMQEALEGNEDD